MCFPRLLLLLAGGRGRLLALLPIFPSPSALCFSFKFLIYKFKEVNNKSISFCFTLPDPGISIMNQEIEAYINFILNFLTLKNRFF